MNLQSHKEHTEGFVALTSLLITSGLIAVFVILGSNEIVRAEQDFRRAYFREQIEYAQQSAEAETVLKNVEENY